jgi:hypothetical protein
MLFNKNKQKPEKPLPRRSAVNTYYRAGGETNTASPFKKKPPKKSARKLIFGFLDIILVVVLVFGLGYSLLVKPEPKLSVNDESFHPLSTYQAATTGQLSQLKYRNKITFNEQSLAAALEAKFPEINNINLELPIFSEVPKIHLNVARPSFQLNSRGVNYIINNSGTAVAKSAALPRLNNLVTINDESNFYVNPGYKVLSAQSVSFINNLIAQCRHANVPISVLTLPNQPEELDLRTSDQPYYVKFYLGGDPIIQSGQFLSSRAHFLSSGSPPSQYLDVRINGKIFYK